MTDQEFAKEQYEQLKRYAEYVWHHVPDSPEKDRSLISHPGACPRLE